MDLFAVAGAHNYRLMLSFSLLGLSLILLSYVTALVSDPGDICQAAYGDETTRAL